MAWQVEGFTSPLAIAEMTSDELIRRCGGHLETRNPRPPTGCPGVEGRRRAIGATIILNIRSTRMARNTIFDGPAKVRANPRATVWRLTLKASW